MNEVYPLFADGSVFSVALEQLENVRGAIQANYMSSGGPRTLRF